MKKFYAYVLVLATMFGIIANAPTTHAAIDDWQKGVSIQSRYATDFESATFRQSVDNAVANGVNHITLVIPVHQDSITSSTVYAGNDTPSDATLQTGLRYIKSKGASAGVAVHDNPNDYNWRAFIKAQDPATWFSSYSALLNRFATAGQAVGMDQMIIATELSGMTTQAHTSYWISMIRDVRQRFSGTLTYSSQRIGDYSDAQSLGFWPQLDVIGISAYYPLGSDTSQSALENAWKKWDANEISLLYAKYGKKVVFTEVGYVSRDGATEDPGSGFQLTTNFNMNTQANAYSALFNYWKDSPSISGVVLWDWNSDPAYGGTSNGDYTPQHKPAQDVMKKWFTTPVQQPVNATYSVTSDVATATVGQPVTLNTKFSASTALSGLLIDVEVYDDQNNKVAQNFVERQSLSPSPTQYSVSFTPSKTGVYTIKAGIFTASWQKNLYWNSQVSTTTANALPAPATPTPQPPVTTPTTPLPTTPTTLPSTVSIWWPGGTVGGSQPFKAVIDGRDAASYDIYWQVDGGQLNKLGDDSNPVPHKESMVDSSGWKWKADSRYTINFVAKDKAGVILSQKSTIITVVHY